MSDSDKRIPKLHRHKSSCTIFLQPMRVPPQHLNTVNKIPITPPLTPMLDKAEDLTSAPIAEREDTSPDVPSSNESEADSFHSSVSDTKPPSQTAVDNVRTLSDNFQKLLSQATEEIKKLKSENIATEEEQNNLLNINKELSRETERLVSEEHQWEIEREGLLQANKEFVEEVKKLYIGEENWKLEELSLHDKRTRLEEEYRKDKEELEESIARERHLNIQQIKQLDHSLDILHVDNTNLKADIAIRMEHNIKTEKELSDEFEKEKISLEETIRDVREELQQVKQEREESEQQVEQLSQELDTTDIELEDVKQENAEQEIHMKQTHEKKVAQIDKRINKLKLENSKYELENEAKACQVEQLQSLENKLSFEIEQTKVENQWLVSNQKDATVKEEKAGELERELEQLKKQLNEERHKVRDVAEWKTQLAGTNNQLKEENRRLLQKVEELDNLLNAEATDIEEVLNMINGMQEQNTRWGRRDSDHSKYNNKYL
eukprot:GFUD01015094.1.p1 GENE.GFUD01015094.1~~GFUD01015094.1.p1  ORF type:complete len:491 (+),score=186.69 GFUD01015094.1:56-1528(+)